MTFTVEVLSPGDFDAWLVAQQSAASLGPEAGQPPVAVR
jgi:heme/copper-type cytochrome/quinol oxidase subunit 2